MNDRSLTGLRLLNDFQRDFPLLPRPFAAIGTTLGLDEQTVLDAYREGLASGAISRVGAVVAPRRIGASTLAAMAVPVARLEEVAAHVNARPEVNHNYEREGSWNLWFVVAARDTARRDQVLQEIGTECGLQVLSLPLREEYHIDLGFDLNGGAKHTVRSSSSVRPEPFGEAQDRLVEGLAHHQGSGLAATGAARTELASAPCRLGEMERALLGALQNGLALTAQPFKILGDQVGLSEYMVIELIEGWLASGMLKRFGVVVRHHELGFTANAMCVWDVADERVDELGRQLAALPGVTLCYQRQRALPHWPYSLYCMIHGKQRDEVEALRTRHAVQLGLDAFPHAVLFSGRRFKQCGARYASGGVAAASPQAQGVAA